MAGMHSPLHLPVGRSSDFIIHVYSCSQWVLKGSASHVQSGRTMVFHSMLELVLALQAKMNENSFPQSSTAHRGWRGAPPEEDTYTFETQSEADTQQDRMPDSILASFLVRVQFRQNSSWQGTMIWMERKESCAFRSLLELLNLVAEAISLSPAPEKETVVSAISFTNGDIVS